MTAWRRIAAAAALASLAVAASSSALAQAKKPAAAARAASAPAAASGAAYAEQFRSVCAACHGANGRSDMPGVPVLAGQPSLYTITQLFLFREGRRSNEAMVALGKQMKDADLRGYSDFIGTLPPVPAPAPA
ncbi:MAG: c-type cytochrome, partial [Burkholderiaceae bacterium]